MKKTRFMSCLLAMTMVLCLLVEPAQSIHIVGEDAKVYVDDVLVKDINAYVDGHNVVRLGSPVDLAKVFPELISEPDPDGETSIILTEWVNYFGFTYKQDGTSLYIYTGTETPEEPDTPEQPSLPEEPEEPETPTADVKVFVNNLRVSDVTLHKSNGQLLVNSYKELLKLFPGAADRGYSSSNFKALLLKNLAKEFGYSLVVNSDRVYLNNNGRAPVEVTINGEIVEFPDQNPIILPPGRTMIPLRAVAELLNCDVEWDNEHRRVKIANSDTTMLLWIDNQVFWYNGNYYSMDVAPTIIADRTMVPLRFVGEVFGFTVKWDASGTVSVARLTK